MYFTYSVATPKTAAEVMLRRCKLYAGDPSPRCVPDGWGPLPSGTISMFLVLQFCMQFWCFVKSFVVMNFVWSLFYVRSWWFNSHPSHATARLLARAGTVLQGLKCWTSHPWVCCGGLDPLGSNLFFVFNKINDQLWNTMRYFHDDIENELFTPIVLTHNDNEQLVTL